MLYGDPAKRTGRENRVIFVCPSCGNRTAPKPWPLQEISVEGSKCGSCTSLRNVQFVAYEDGVENDDAERALAGVL